MACGLAVLASIPALSAALSATAGIAPRWSVLCPLISGSFPNDASVPPNVEVFESIPVGPWQADGPAFLHVIGLLRNSATFAAAQSEMNSAAAQIDKTWRTRFLGNFAVSFFRFTEDAVRREVLSTTLLCFSVEVMIMLSSAARISPDLLMARARRRLREPTIRAALGASRGRLARQFLTEDVVSEYLAASLHPTDTLLRRHLATPAALFVSFDRVCVDARVLAFTFAVSLGISVLFGLAPVFSVRRINLTRDLRESTRQSHDFAPALGRFLVSAEVALAFVLLTSTGLLMRSFINILHADPGFRAGDVSTFRVSVPTLLPTLIPRALPGIQSALCYLLAFLSMLTSRSLAEHVGADENRNGQSPLHAARMLPAIGATLLGRPDSLNETTPASARRHHRDVLSAPTLARSKCYRAQNQSPDSPQGFYQFQRDWAVIVGVVHHVQYHSLTAIVRPQIYVLYPLAPRPSMSFVLHTSSPDSGLAVAVRNTVHP